MSDHERLGSPSSMNPISAVMRLRVPAVSALEHDFGPMIVAQGEFREPHAFSEREQNPPFDGASLPTDPPEPAIRSSFDLAGAEREHDAAPRRRVRVGV